MDGAAWHKALLAELDFWGAQTAGRDLVSIFFGGGTPSLMPPVMVEALIARARHWWRASDTLEVTLEANPTSVEAQKLADFRAAGVNRLSLGIQALNDADLRALGRQHSAAEALGAIELAATLFPRFSFDLIYARPDQTAAAWAHELQHALTFAPSHLSVYQLTIEPGTPFALRHARGDLVTPDDEISADLYDQTQAILERAGLPAYEISNHAREGHTCRHNLAYWRYEDYVGIGPGAHGRITRDGTKHATRTHRAPETWLAQVTTTGHGLAESEPLSLADQAHEALLMGLRLTEGIPLPRLAALGFTPAPVTLTRLQQHGLLTPDPNTLRATPEGRLRLNGVIAALVG